MQNADRSAGRRTRNVKGIIAATTDTRNILAPATRYSNRDAGSRVDVAVGAVSKCCVGDSANNILAPIITRVVPGDSSLNVFFDPDRSLTYWTVSTQSPDPLEDIEDVSGNGPSILVENLENGRAYTLRLKKITPEGSSPLSAPFTNAIPLPVPGVAISASSETLTVTVTPPAPVTGFTVIGYEESLDGENWNAVVLSGANTFTKTDLPNGIEQTIYVRAVYSTGPGPAGSATGTPATYPATPTNLRATITATTATISFTQTFDGGSPIIAYKYSLDGGSFITVSRADTSIALTGLTAGQTYYVRVIAVNAIGDSPTSIPHAVTPASTGPVITALRTIGDATWNPPAGVTSVDYLVVGGGGGGGGSYNTGAGGGGGGGQLFYASGYGVSSTTVYDITVGAGGAGGIGISSAAGDTDGGDGSQSRFGDIIALGGGGGGKSLNDRTGVGGAQGTGSVAPTGGKGGRIGTPPTLNNQYGGGGGGGMGSAGITANISSSAGGDGISYNISGLSITYSAGGNGGRCNVNANGANASAFTGAGGGGASSTSNDLSNGGAGGSGIVILAYNVPISIPDRLLYFDPADPRSLPPTGSTVTSIGTSTISGTMTSGVTRVNDATAGNVFNFIGYNNTNGITSYINFSNFNFGTTFTVVGWVKPADKSNINALIANDTSGFAPLGFKLGWNQYQQNDKYLLLESASTNATSGSATIVTNVWQQIVYSLDRPNQKIRFYKNGQQVGSDGVVPSNLNPFTTNGFKIGAFTDDSFHMQGLLGELIVYPAALNSAQVSIVYNQQKARYGF